MEYRNERFGSVYDVNPLPATGDEQQVSGDGDSGGWYRSASRSLTTEDRRTVDARARL